MPIKNVSYHVRVKGDYGYFICRDWSGYAKAGKYGLKQCKAHAEEIRKTSYHGRRPYLNVMFEIVKRVSTVEVVATV